MKKPSLVYKAIPAVFEVCTLRVAIICRLEVSRLDGGNEMKEEAGKDDEVGNLLVDNDDDDDRCAFARV